MGAIRPRELKSGESAARNWERINALGLVAADGGNHASQLRYRDRRPGSGVVEALHPFKIYQPPWEFVDGIDWSTFWRTFRVRAGQVLGVDATGTDAATDAVPNADPDALYYPSGTVDVIVPAATAKFWFWLEVNGGAAVVRYGDDPTATRYPVTGTALWTSTNAWTASPVPDAQHVPIGWVDTNTHADELRAVVRQLLREDVGQVGWGATRYRVKGVYSTYLVCRTWDGTTEGTTDVYIAKPPYLRWYASAWPGYTAVGAAVTFVWSALTGNIDGQRTASSSGATTQTEIVVVVWQFAANGSGIDGGYDEIWADTPVGGTGVTTVTESAYGGAASPAAAGKVLTLMDDNRNGRYWEQIS